MSNDTDINNHDPIEDAISQINEENLETSSTDMTSEEALSFMTAENTASKENPKQYDVLDKKEEYRILTIIEKTELLIGDFFKKLAAVDSRFNNVAQAFVNNAVKIGESKKELTKEEQNLVMINVAAAVAVKGIGALWQSIQTELQLRGIIQVFAQEAEEKMPYIGMLIDWLDTADVIAFERLLDSTDIDVLDINLELSRGLNYYCRLANFLYSVYDTSLKGEFTKMPYPTMYDVNQALISNLTHIESKETESEQLKANRAALSTVAKRIRSVMTGETELPDLIDVMIASDGQLMATAITMGLPAPDSFEDDEEELGETPHFPFEELTMIPESIDYVSEFSSLKDCGDSHGIAQKINNNTTIDNVRTYIDEFWKNQKTYNSRLTLYGINSWLLAGVTFMLFWKVWDWAWYWSLLMGIVLFIFNAKCSTISNITRISRIKAILLERDLIKFSKSEGGYTEVIDFHQLRRKNNNVFFCAVIGGIVGLFFGPFGVIAGIIIGSLIGLLIKSYKPEEEDWRDISIGSGIWAKIWCAILSLALLYLIYFAFFKSPSAESLHNTDADTIDDEVAYPVAEVAQVETAAQVEETEAITDLYRIYYPYSPQEFNESIIDIDGRTHHAYSEHIQQKFKELGITKPISNNQEYTNAFQNLLNRIAEEEEKSGSLILDSDLLTSGQDIPWELDLSVSKITVKDDNNVNITALLSHSGVKITRVYVMKRENGRFRIDDIIDEGESTRKFLETELENSKNYQSEETSPATVNANTVSLSGKVGDYPVVFQLTLDENRITGRYAFASTLKKYGDKPESYFYLNGFVGPDNNLSLTSKLYNKTEDFEYISLSEFPNSSGREWTGELKNKNTGSVFSVNLYVD